MAIGHWSSLAECQKLTQSVLIPGVIEEDIKRNNIMDVIPVAQASGKTIKWNREKVTLEDAVKNVDIGEQLSWTADVEYTEVEAELKRKYIQRVLDHFVVDVYGTINNYEAQVLWEMKKGIMRRLGNDVIYDDATYGDKEFDGLHALAAEQTGSLNIDDASTLALSHLRLQHDAMKHGIDFCYIPYLIAMRIDEAYMEMGLASLADNTRGTLARINYGVNDQGKRVMYFDGVPFARTDFLEAEADGTGEGSNAKGKFISGTEEYSIFNIKFGDVFNGEPGLGLGFGNTQMLGQFYKIVPFDELEDFDAGGIRLVTYVTPLLGSKLGLGRIHGITDGVVTA